MRNEIYRLLVFIAITFVVNIAMAGKCQRYICKEKNPSHCGMEIYALEGHKITVTKHSAKNGYDSQRELVKKYLKIGGIYTVKRTIVERSSTYVLLKEVAGVKFNSVNFVDYCVQSKDDIRKHPDWESYN